MQEEVRPIMNINSIYCESLSPMFQDVQFRHFNNQEGRKWWATEQEAAEEA